MDSARRPKKNRLKKIVKLLLKRLFWCELAGFGPDFCLLSNILGLNVVLAALKIHFKNISVMFLPRNHDPVTTDLVVSSLICIFGEAVSTIS